MFIALELANNVLVFVALAQTMSCCFTWHWPMVYLLMWRGPNNVLSFHAALALASIDLCRIIQSGCSLCSFSVYVVFLFFQVILSSKSWKGFQNFSSLSVCQVLDVIFKSRADATDATCH